MNLKNFLLGAALCAFAFSVTAATPPAPPAQGGNTAAGEKRKVEDKDHDDKAGEDKDKDDKKEGKRDHKNRHDHKPKKP
jgi:ribosomal protein L12E/L44/L45/RPP1/RPP2